MLIHIAHHLASPQAPNRWLLSRLGLAWTLALLLGLKLLASPGAQAQTVAHQLPDSLMPPVALKLVEVAVLRNVPTTLGLPEVLAGKAGEFVPQAQLNFSDAGGSESDFWMRLTLGAEPVPNGQRAPAINILEFPKASLDEIRLYHPPLEGTTAWRQQTAGDTIAQRDWFMRGLYPRFMLPHAQELMAKPDKRQVLYVQVKQYFPLKATVQIVTAAQSSTKAQGAFLLLGLAGGAIILAGISALMVAFLSRDSIFAWYFLYAVSSMLANASHSGLAQMFLWPIGGYWPSAATLVWMLLGAACQLQFCRVLFQPGGERTWPSWLAIVIGALCAALAVACAVSSGMRDIKFYVCIALLLMSIAVSSLLVFLAWRQGNKLALVWMLAFIPLFGTILFGVLGGLGLIEDDLGYNLPIYATALEVILLGLALQWFARERHGQMEREKALAQMDPLTGFATRVVFQNRLLHDWHSADTQKRDMAVAYVQLTTQALDARQKEQLLMRSVRVLRSATHTHDVVARLDGQLMAILMPHTSMGDDLSQRLSRVVALGLMPDRSDQQTPILQFRIAATTALHYDKPVAQLDEDLRSLLAEPKGWGSKPIRYLGRQLQSATPPAARLDESAMEELWDKALARELQDQSKPV